MKIANPYLRRCLVLLLLAFMLTPYRSVQSFEPRIVFASNRYGNWDIYSMDANGDNLLQLTDDPASYEEPAVSPDGKRLAFKSNRVLSPELFVMDSDGDNTIRITHDSFVKYRPSWSSNGKRVAFSSFRLPAGNWEIYAIGADGANEINLSNHKEPDNLPSWSPDGTKIAFVSMLDGGAFGAHHIFVMNANGKGRRNLTGDADLIDSSDPAWSPDGTKIAFRSQFNLMGYDIYVMTAEGENLERLTEDSKSSMPAFSPDGRKIAFVSTRGGATNTYLMDADGRNVVKITKSPPDIMNISPSWQPSALAVNPDGTSPTTWGLLKRRGNLR